MNRRTIAWIVMSISSLAMMGAVVVGAQPMPAPPVRYTEAISRDVRRTVELTGSIEARDSSVIASEVAGLVVRLAAREGDLVKRGAPLVQLRRDNLELRVRAARGELDEAKARLKLAELAHERAKGLFEEEVLSREGLDEATSQADANRGRVIQLEADLARLEDDLDRATIRAPFTGYVVRELTAAGSWAQAGGGVMEMVDIQDLEVNVDVPSGYYAGLKKGGRASVVIQDLGGREIEATVRAIIPRANPQARTFPVKVAVPNPDGSLAVGMLAQVRIPVGTPERGVLVPKDAIVSQGTSRMVYVIAGDNAVQPVPVETGLSQGAWIEVRGNIKAGDRVVTRGNERLRPGQTVQPEPIEYEMP